MDTGIRLNKKNEKRRVSPVQLHRYKKTLEKENKESKEDSLDIGLLSDYLEEIESKIDDNSSQNEDLYSQIQELRNRIEKIENVLFK